MGVDLKPRKETGVEMHVGRGTYGQYNWSGWSWLQEFLDSQNAGIDLPETNDGKYIKKAECVKIAKLLEENPESYENTDWVFRQAKWWKACGGCWVY